MIQTINLSKTYAIKKKEKFFKNHVEYKQAVKNLNLEIHEGKIVGVLGVNGAGKTTTIKMLATLLEPTSGEIRLDNLQYTKQNRQKIKAKINLISGGERSLYWRLTGRENLEYFGSLYSIDNLKDRIDECLEIVGLSDSADQLVETYSKGMKQRLQIARGIINKPKYLFMDEPTLGLDVAVARNLREYIKKLAKEENTAVILSTHYMREAEELCDYIYVIDHGENVVGGTVTDLKKKYTQANQYDVEIEKDIDLFKTKVLDCLDCTYELENLVAHIKSQENIVSKLFYLAEENEIHIVNFQEQETSLEDCIMEIISKKENA